MNKTGILLDPKRFAVHDGPGIRTTFFLKGCPLHCIWCHNPESISAAPRLACYAHKCLHCGECVSLCPRHAHALREKKHEFLPDLCNACGVCEPECPGGALKLYGRNVSVEEVLGIALEDRPFYQESGGGVTLSGGEPLMQPEFTLAFLSALKENGIHTALDTCCFVSQEILRTVLPATDLFLVDFKHADSAEHRKLTGQPNEPVRNNLRFLSEHGAEIEIRIPFVPGCNDSDANMEATGQFLGSLRGITCVRLLPYHSLARTKYKALGLPDTMPRTEPPDDERLRRAAAILNRYGLNARSGRE